LLDRPEGVNRVLQHVSLSITGGHVRTRLEDLLETGTTKLSLRALCCVVWPHIKEADIETCMGWCRAYQAQSTLQEVLRAIREEDVELDVEDIDELFEAIDSNGDGQLSLDELSNMGHLDISTARRLVDRLDSDANGSLSKAEVKSLIHQLDIAFKEQFKAAFAAAQMPQKEMLQQQH